MPTRVCAQPGCPNLTRGTSYCLEQHGHRNRKRGNDPRLIAQIRERDGNTCARCGSTDRLAVHHLTRRADGGTDTPTNLLTLCHDCHQAEHHG